MNVKSITFGPIRGGPQEGVISIWVRLSKDSPTLSPSEVVSKIVGFRSGALKQVVLLGDYMLEDNSVMYAFCKALRDLEYGVRIEANGQHFTPWMSLASWICVSIQPGEAWLRFNCSELRYEIQSPREVEPSLPAKTAPMYVISKDIKDAVGFVKNSKHLWGVIVDTNPKFMEFIYKPAEKNDPN